MHISIQFISQQIKKARKYALWVAIAGIMICGIYNVNTHIISAQKAVIKAFERLQSGRYYHCGKGFRTRRIQLAEKHVARTNSLFFFTITRLRNSVATEGNIVQLNYYLYPTRVFYEHNEDLNRCDYIMADDAFEYHIQEALKELKIDKQYHVIDRVDDFIIYKRDRDA